jgi:hypothetical protein
MSEKKTEGPVFAGVRLPNGAYLPIEIIQAMPFMSLAETRVVLATVYYSLQFGNGEPLTLTEFERLTGLARPSVVAGLKAALERGLLTRYAIPGYRGHDEFVYELNVYPDSIGSKNEPIEGEKRGVIGSKNEPIDDLIGSNFELNGDIKFSNADVNLINNINLTAADLNLINGGERKNLNRLRKILNRLQTCGVYLAIAHRLVQEYPLDRIEAFLGLYPLAVQVYGVGPGWLVAAIKNMERDPEETLNDIQERAQDHRDWRVETQLEEGTLPVFIQEQFRSLGWRGSLADVETAWREDPERVRQWLWYAGKQGWNGALLRTVLRNSGEYPPELDPSSSQSRRRYIEGEYADFIEH